MEDDPDVQAIKSILGESSGGSEDPDVMAIKQILGGDNADGKIMPTSVPVTQAFGNSNPGVEVMSGGVNYGADLGASQGTPVSLPPGIWEVVDSYSADTTPGHIGDSTNKGYGNSVLVKNFNTGEKLRFSHLSHNQLQSGQIVPGGTAIGSTGMTGNVTGPHLDLEYYNPSGQVQDVLQSPYSQYIPTQQ